MTYTCMYKQHWFHTSNTIADVFWAAQTAVHMYFFHNARVWWIVLRVFNAWCACTYCIGIWLGGAFKYYKGNLNTCTTIWTYYHSKYTYVYISCRLFSCSAGISFTRWLDFVAQGFSKYYGESLNVPRRSIQLSHGVKVHKKHPSECNMTMSRMCGHRKVEQ